MNVLVLGGTGYIGGAVVERLLDTGHRVIVVTRKAFTADLPEGVRIVSGDLTDPEALAGLVAGLTDAEGQVDAVIHAAAPLGDTDLALAEALLGARAGRPLIWTSGVWVLGRTENGTEDAPVAPLAITGARAEIEAKVLAGGGIVLRPGVVHGRGGGIPAMFTGWARDFEHGRWVGTPESPRWPLVHVDDLADLYVLALTAAEPGTILHGVTEPGVRTRDLARAGALGAGLTDPVLQEWPEEAAAEYLSPEFAEALALDQVVTAERARALGWQPSRPSAVEDLSTGSYAG